jgi:hypothetical protein
MMTLFGSTQRMTRVVAGYLIHRAVRVFCNTLQALEQHSGEGWGLLQFDHKNIPAMLFW